MSSTPRRRRKPETDFHETRPGSSSSPSSSLIMEPPESLLPSKKEVFRLITLVVIASSVAFACHFLVSFLSSSPKPFCDSNLDSLDALSDFCEPCPSNGECYHGKLECIHGYRKHGNLCVEDGDINETAKKLSEWIKVHLCEAYAQLLCNGTGKIWVQENDIWEDLCRHELMENLGPDDAIYLYTKRRTMEIVGKLLETRTNSNGIKELKCPDLLVEGYKPFSCRIHQWLSKHAHVVVPVCVLLLGCVFLQQKVRRVRYLSTRVEELYSQVCDILEENAMMSKNVSGECEPWVVASRLRDHLLFPRERKDPELWKKVEELLQEDSRVDRYPKLVKGESKVVWEWQVEGSLSSSRLRKKGEESKLRSSESKDVKLERRPQKAMAEPKALMF